jgi:hypothetical protein
MMGMVRLQHRTRARVGAGHNLPDDPRVRPGGRIDPLSGGVGGARGAAASAVAHKGAAVAAGAAVAPPPVLSGHAASFTPY